MYVSLADMKSRLGIGDNSQDVFLTAQIQLISDTIDEYIDRRLEANTYTQTYYYDDFNGNDDYKKALMLYEYPLNSITSIKEIVKDDDGVAVNTTTLTPNDYRVQANSGMIYKTVGGVKTTWFSNLTDSNSSIEVEYNAGYVTIPTIVQEAVFTLVEERYNKNNAGINLSFGPDIQKVSVPGVMSVDFDFSLQQNERGSKFGMILGNWLNVVDNYRSERALIGQVRDTYVS